MNNIKTVIVFMMDKHMGNLVVSIPAIQMLRDFFREKDFKLVIDESYSDIARAFFPDEEIVSFPRRRLKGGGLYTRLISYLRFIKRLRALRPSLSIDLECRQASATFAFLSGAVVRVGKDSGERPYLYNKRVRLAPGVHKMWNYIEIARATGAPPSAVIPRPRLLPQWAESLREKLEAAGIDKDGEIISIHPSAGKIYKQWPLEKFASLSDLLVDKGYEVCFVGGVEDKDNVKKVVHLMRNESCDFAGRLTLGELMVLFRMSSLYIGNDSGPLHLASVMDTPVVGLYGPADEERWSPIGRRGIVLRGDSPCEKCKGRDCEHDYRCIARLGLDEVMQGVESMLEGVGA